MTTFGEPLYRISQTKGNFSKKIMNSEKDYIASDDGGLSDLKPSIISTTTSFSRNY